MSVKSPSSLTEHVFPLSDKNEDNTHVDTYVKNPICHVLNLVFDYVLRPPCPLEKAEYYNSKEEDCVSEKTTRTEVPVIRIFGPLFTCPDSKKSQSCCIYIHNAFPYIIARPRREYFEDDTTNDDGEGGWWSEIEKELSTLLPIIKISLEEIMKSSMTSVSDATNNNTTQQQHHNHRTYIRKVSIVKGREFYSFSPCPPMSFLKVEYYNPTDRWRIKILLEKGLEILDGDNENKIVPFHCYEAHIPYSMQFYKDYNLAGMKHIKIGCDNTSMDERKNECEGGSDGQIMKFRMPLPRQTKHTTLGVHKNPHVVNNKKQQQNHSSDSNNSFLESNVPKTMCWNKDDYVVKTLKNKELLNEQEQQEQHQQRYYWLNKETSCEIELDIDVSHILNVHDKIVSSSCDKDNNNNDTDIHWRAVPSLQELWMDEKTRMKKILPPNLDFLNYPDNDTIQKQQQQSKSGSQEAMKGMCNLMSKGLKDDYKKAINDIIIRYEEELDEEEEDLLLQGWWRKQQQKAKLHDHSNTTASTNSKELSQQQQHASCDNEDLMNALTSLALQFQTPPVVVHDTTTNQAQKNDITISSSPSTNQNKTDINLSNFTTPPRVSFKSTTDSATQHPSFHSQLSSNLTTPSQRSRVVVSVDDWNFAKRVDGEDCSLENHIDPLTLTPYADEGDDDDDNVDNEEKGMEQELYNLSQLNNEEQQQQHQEQNVVYNKPIKAKKKVDYSYLYTQDFEDLNVNLFEEEFHAGDAVNENNISIDFDDDNDDGTNKTDRNRVIMETNNQSEEEVEIESTDNNGNENNTVLSSHYSNTSLAFEEEEDSSSVTYSALTFEKGNRFLGLKGRRPPLRCDCRDLSKLKLHPIPTLYNHFQHDNGEDKVVLQEKEQGQLLSWISWKQSMTPKSSSLQKKIVDVIDLESDDENDNNNGNDEIYVTPVSMPPSRKHVKKWLKKKNEKEKLMNDNKNSCYIHDDSDVRKKKHEELFHEVHESDGAVVRGVDLMLSSSSLDTTITNNFFSQVSQMNTTIQSSQASSFLSLNNNMSHSQDSANTIPYQNSNNDKIESSQQQQRHHTSKSASSSVVLSSQEEDTQLSKSMHPLGSAEEDLLLFSSSQSISNPLVFGRQNIGGHDGVDKYYKAKTGISLQEEEEEDDDNMHNSNKQSQQRRKQPPSPLTLMSIEIHVQCRTGKAGLNDSKEIAMKPDCTRDGIFAIVYVFACDPGEGEAMQFLEKGCIFIPVETELRQEQEQEQTNDTPSSFLKRTLGISSTRMKMEKVQSERHLLLRFASIVQWKDPDVLVSWDTLGLGIGYLVERGAASSGGQEHERGAALLDMVRLLGRTPKIQKNYNNVPQQSKYEALFQGINEEKTKELTSAGTETEKTSASFGGEGKSNSNSNNKPDVQWNGSALGSEWDEMAGAGAAASSIIGRLILCGWKLLYEEVPHPNASYQPAMVASVLKKRIPFHDDLTLTAWYADYAKQRYRVLEYRLTQALSTLLLLDSLDIIGRAGEAARLSGVEFSHSFPGIRGSQYKVEGVLLRALQSVWSDERGNKKGHNPVRVLGEDDANNESQQHTSTVSSMTSSKSQILTPWKLKRNHPILPSDETTPTMNNSQGDYTSCGSDKIVNSNNNTATNDDNNNRGYFFYSPSREDTIKQEALECQAMTLEPQSGFIYDPVIVCDFTALYPSLIIAYNLCYTTCFGKLDYHSTRSELCMEGKTTGRMGPLLYPERYTAAVLKHHVKSCCNSSKIEEMEFPNYKSDRAYIVPTGSLYVSENVLKGVLPQVLKEMLETRAMIKKASKVYSRHVPNLAPSILRQLEARQLALKYVANVTYGYTSATFSGRSAMPLLADTIVECGRRTLQNAIDLANAWGYNKSGKWHGAEVVYGDTDSLFIKLPGRSVQEAFLFGEEFCKAVTASNPPPIALKLEKVYVATLLQTKKKYCGMKMDSPDQRKPTLEVKGMEIIRRDQCPLTQKILRHALTILFQRGIKDVKRYLYRQWALIHSGRVSVSDFIFTGRVRSQYRNNSIGPVQAALAKRLAEADPGRVIRHKERLAYVIVAAPGVHFKLRDCVLTPMELLEQWDSYTLHSTYYITKHVNASLQRCLGLPPYYIDVHSWYSHFPKPRKRIHYWPVSSTNRRRRGNTTMISSYFGSDICSLCGVKCVITSSNNKKGNSSTTTRTVVCSNCQKDKAKATFTAMTRLHKSQTQASTLARICSVCNGCHENLETFAAGTIATTIDNRNQQFGLNTIVTQASNTTAPATLANCVCIDCPITYQRHRAKEAETEALELCIALELF